MPTTKPTSQEEKRYSKMTREELLALCRQRYISGGIEALSFKSLQKDRGLYASLYRAGLRQKILLHELGLEEDGRKWRRTLPIVRRGQTLQRWNWEAVIIRAKQLYQQEGHLPSAMWLNKHGEGSLVQVVYNLGHTWDELRSEVGDFTDSQFVESRNGLRWLSHAEASLSNFLFARGIEHKKGMRYPISYAEATSKKYAFYDLHFLSVDGRWVDVEVWGDKPNGHNEEGYKQVRTAKELFNQDNLNFLGLHYQTCYDEHGLAAALMPYIGVIEPFVFNHPTDPLIQTTHWSNADELLDTCRHLAASMPDGIFPTEEWLRKRGKWSTRPGDVYNTLSVYIKTWLGGVRNLRTLLDQAPASSTQWDKSSAIKAYKEFYDQYGMTPDQARRKSSEISTEIRDQANRISAAVLKYAEGGNIVKEALGITTVRQVKWTRESILRGFQNVITKWGKSPMQLRHDHKNKKITLSAAEYRNMGQLIDAVGRNFNGVAEVYAALDFQPPMRTGRPRKTKPSP